MAGKQPCLSCPVLVPRACKLTGLYTHMTHVVCCVGVKPPNQTEPQGSPNSTTCRPLVFVQHKPPWTLGPGDTCSGLSLPRFLALLYLSVSPSVCVFLPSPAAVPPLSASCPTRRGSLRPTETVLCCLGSPCPSSLHEVQ